MMESSCSFADQAAGVEHNIVMMDTSCRFADPAAAARKEGINVCMKVVWLVLAALTGCLTCQ